MHSNEPKHGDSTSCSLDGVELLVSFFWGPGTLTALAAEVTLLVHELTSELPATPPQLVKIQNATAVDALCFDQRTESSAARLHVTMVVWKPALGVAGSAKEGPTPFLQEPPGPGIRRRAQFGWSGKPSP